MRYCPQCRSEYRDDVTHCSDDGALLVASKPAEGPKLNQLTAVLTLADRFEAEELAEGLLDEGLDVSLVSNRGQTLGNITSPGEIYSIVVAEQDAERARVLLVEWRSEYESQQGAAESAAEQESAATPIV
jgi:hypothetical protein